jgi:hypothetical protein
MSNIDSGDVSTEQGVTKLGRRNSAVTNIDSGDVSTKEGVTKLAGERLMCPADIR